MNVTLNVFIHIYEFNYEGKVRLRRNRTGRCAVKVELPAVSHLERTEKPVDWAYLGRPRAEPCGTPPQTSHAQMEALTLTFCKCAQSRRRAGNRSVVLKLGFR